MMVLCSVSCFSSCAYRLLRSMRSRKKNVCVFFFFTVERNKEKERVAIGRKRNVLLSCEEPHNTKWDEDVCVKARRN